MGNSCSTTTVATTHAEAKDYLACPPTSNEKYKVRVDAGVYGAGQFSSRTGDGNLIKGWCGTIWVSGIGMRLI